MPKEHPSEVCYLKPQAGFLACYRVERKFDDKSIAIPDGSQGPEPPLAIVVAAGPPELTDTGKPKYPEFKPGDVIYVPGNNPDAPSLFYAGMKFRHNGFEYWQYRQGAVAFKLDDAYLTTLGLDDVEYPQLVENGSKD